LFLLPPLNEIIITVIHFHKKISTYQAINNLTDRTVQTFPQTPSEQFTCHAVFQRACRIRTWNEYRSISRRSESVMSSSLRPSQMISAVRRERASGLVKQASNESDRSICREVSAWESPFSVSTEMSELPWMRPSAFQVLCPCRTSTTRFASRSDGSDAPGWGLGELSTSRTLEQRMEAVEARPRPYRPASAAGRERRGGCVWRRVGPERGVVWFA
jgi:hypothetical protein